MWDIEKGNCLFNFKGHEKQINCISYNPDRKTIASGSSDKIVRVWDMSSGECILTLKGHKSSVNSISYSPDGKHLLLVLRIKQHEYGTR
ncbi:WD40 repeat domain-containing protein [Candidatus Uabimicrobium sp. HlEnr_7]